MEDSLVKRDKQVIWHPYTSQKHAPDPIAVVKGEGVYLIDEEGNYYIDAISSWWVNLHGHAHPYIAEKIYQQAKTLEQVIFAGFTHEPAVELAEKMIKILPGDFSKIFYSDNGSTAVEVAIKMAIQYWWNLEAEDRMQKTEYRLQNTGYKPRNKIIALSNSYHGDTFGAMSVSDRGIFTLAFQEKLFEVIFINPSLLPDDNMNVDARQESMSDGATLYPTFTTPLSEIACFIYEPLLQAAGGMKMYKVETLNQILKTFKQEGIICIADEVMTGFGRTGKLFASEFIKHQPDIVCLSKGLTGGTMALGVTACSKKIHDAFVSTDKLKTFFHGHSYTANPLACTAALASLYLLQHEECTRNIQRITQQNEIFIKDLANYHLLNTDSGSTLPIKNLRQLGTIVAFEVETNGNDDYLNNISGKITEKALSKGVFIRPLGNTVYLLPPYCISDIQLQKVYTVIVEILKEI